jgi:hypothetical protein
LTVNSIVPAPLFSLGSCCAYSCVLLRAFRALLNAVKD